jgi:hypothetical protein
VHRARVLAREVQVHRLGARREEQRVERERVAALDLETARRHVDARRAAAHDLDAMLRVESRRPERDPLLGCVAGEIVLGEVRRSYGASASSSTMVTAPVEPAPAQHLRRGGARRARTDDDDVSQRRRQCGAPRIGRREGIALHLSVTTTFSPRRSTRQHATGESAGRRERLAGVRRLKHAWCQGQRTVSPTIAPSESGPP